MQADYIVVGTGSAGSVLARHSKSRSVSPGRPLNSEVPARLRHILTVASKEFVAHGYAQASVGRIAATPGCRKRRSTCATRPRTNY